MYIYIIYIILTLCNKKRKKNQPVVNLSPIIPPITKNKKNSFKGDIDSFKNNVPTTTVPIAPMAVQQAYAVPNGIPSTAFSNSTILIIKNITVKKVGRSFVNPSENFSGTAHSTSHIPATTKYIQGFKLSLHYMNSGALIPKSFNEFLSVILEASTSFNLKLSCSDPITCCDL